MQSGRRQVLSTLFVVVAVLASSGFTRASPEQGVENLATASRPASRDRHTVVEYDVFGDSIVSGFGVPAHLTWVGGVSYHLFATQPNDVEHRFYNHAIEGQSISTPSFLAVDPARSTLLEHLRDFLANPGRTTAPQQRTIVITPSVNELVVSTRGPSGRDRVETAITGVRQAVALLSSAGVPSGQIVVLPMPPVGRQYVAEFDAATDVDQAINSMIASVNAGLRDLLDVRSYATLDPNNDGLAADAFFESLVGPTGGLVSDGLHLDVDGHRALAADIDDYFRQN